MELIATIATTCVALLHLYIMYIEMFLWDKPKGMKIFKLQPEFAKASKVMAANQGLYNGFLAAGLLWGIWLGVAGIQVTVFFLLCVVIAGVYGAITSSRKILFVQGLPGLIALLAVLFAS
ncbi:DUF1304 domain-containing protein [Marinomonas sp. CT5]|uniref:DUF1304 domain-containing protein n=1 Tax=Marinomonas sp. CT5 TaxID=2066133 RepID=UPI001799CE61|nr:DUF1304 domain-containing protein [Marinomonas sp. CT5]NVK75039.1 DUF1304 domain-containing protein [Oceanospirillaceae bacterium]QUX95190.1 DUF1304 domain-containing protein [Marinomonas sp. CT5]